MHACSTVNRFIIAQFHVLHFIRNYNRVEIQFVSTNKETIQKRTRIPRKVFNEAKYNGSWTRSNDCRSPLAHSSNFITAQPLVSFISIGCRNTNTLPSYQNCEPSEKVWIPLFSFISPGIVFFLSYTHTHSSAMNPSTNARSNVWTSVTWPHYISIAIVLDAF